MECYQNCNSDLLINNLSINNMFEPNLKTFKIFSKLFRDENDIPIEFQSGLTFIDNFIMQTNGVQMIKLSNNNNSIFDVSTTSDYYLDLNTNEIKTHIVKTDLNITSTIHTNICKFTKKQIENLIDLLKNVQNKISAVWIQFENIKKAFNVEFLIETLEIYIRFEINDIYELCYLNIKNNIVFAISSNIDKFETYGLVNSNYKITRHETFVDIKNNSISEEVWL